MVKSCKEKCCMHPVGTPRPATKKIRKKVDDKFFHFWEKGEKEESAKHRKNLIKVIRKAILNWVRQEGVTLSEYLADAIIKEEAK